MGQTLRTEAKDCGLEVSLQEAKPGVLRLSYKFYNNSSSQNAYLFNLLYERVDEKLDYMVDRNSVYVELGNGRVIVSKKLVPVPPTIDVEKPNIPCVNTVKPGESFEESVSLTLPLTPRTPYLRLTSHAATPKIESRRLSFELGYFFAQRGAGDNLAKTVKTSQGPALRFDPFPQSSQSILRVGPFDIDVYVLIPPERERDGHN